MARYKVAVIIFFIIASIVVLNTVCSAEERPDNNMLRKLGRGVANVTTSVLEVPKSIQEMFYEEGPAAAASWGLLDGIYKFASRTVIGVYEIVTFPIPLPAGYAPIMQPEFLFSPHDE